MRNLKRALSLALASVMLLGMMVVGNTSGAKATGSNVTTTGDSAVDTTAYAAKAVVTTGTGSSATSKTIYGTLTEIFANSDYTSATKVVITFQADDTTAVSVGTVNKDIEIKAGSYKMNLTGVNVSSEKTLTVDNVNTGSTLAIVNETAGTVTITGTISGTVTGADKLTGEIKLGEGASIDKVKAAGVVKVNGDTTISTSAPADATITVADGTLEVTMAMSNLTTGLKFTVTPKSGTEADAYDIIYEVK